MPSYFQKSIPSEYVNISIKPTRSTIYWWWNLCIKISLPLAPNEKSNRFTQKICQPPRKLHIIMLLTLLGPFYYQLKNEIVLLILNSINIWAERPRCRSIDGTTDKPSSNRHISWIKILLYGVRFYNLEERLFINIILRGEMNLVVVETEENGVR